MIETGNSTATTYDDRDLNEDRSSTNAAGHSTPGIDPDGRLYFYKVTAINSQGAGVASELLTAQWTHRPRPGVNRSHTRLRAPEHRQHRQQR